MNKLLLTFLFICFSSSLYSYNLIKRDSIIVPDSLKIKETYTDIQRDSIYKKLGYKHGDAISVKVLFIIDEYGNVIIEKIRSPHDIFTIEALRIFSKLPEFKATFIDGKPIRKRFMQPISFVINNKIKKDKKKNKKKNTN